MRLNKYLYLLAIFIFLEMYPEIKIIFDHFTFHALYFAFLRHPLAFFMIFSFPYLYMRLKNIR